VCVCLRFCVRIYSFDMYLTWLAIVTETIIKNLDLKFVTILCKETHVCKVCSWLVGYSLFCTNVDVEKA
jgi:hypothetical protein